MQPRYFLISKVTNETLRASLNIKKGWIINASSNNFDRMEKEFQFMRRERKERKFMLIKSEQLLNDTIPF